MSLFTVLMPVKNGGPYIRQAMESVLSQEGADLELLVVDDGSVDGSMDTVRSFDDPRIRIVEGPGTGISGALNKGIEEAQGELLAECDQDDLYPPGRLRWQARFLSKTADFGAVCGHYRTIDARGSAIADFDQGQVAQEITEELMVGTIRNHFCAYAIRTDALRNLGGFRGYFRTCEDVDMLLRLPEQARVWYEPQPAYTYRIHGASITHAHTLEIRDFYEAIADRCQRQRQAGHADDVERGCAPEPPVMGPVSRRLAEEQIEGQLVGKAWALYQRGAYSAALRIRWKALKMNPASFGSWANLAVLVAKSLAGVSTASHSPETGADPDESRTIHDDRAP